jgi:hypothetical protein
VLGVFLTTAGLYPISPAVTAWIALNCAGSMKRAVGIGAMISFSQLGGVSNSLWSCSFAQNLTTKIDRWVQYLYSKSIANVPCWFWDLPRNACGFRYYLAHRLLLHLEGH